MLRRLFFLFPKEEDAVPLVNELTYRGIERRYIHAVSRVQPLRALPKATRMQENDIAFSIDKLIWNSNLVLFVLSLMGILVSLFIGNILYSFISLVIMGTAFFLAEQVLVKLPNVHLAEFESALAHGEVLLMIDVPSDRVAEIEYFIHHHHPVAAVGGVSWTVDALGI